MSLNVSEKLMDQKTANQVNEADMSAIIRKSLPFIENLDGTSKNSQMLVLNNFWLKLTPMTAVRPYQGFHRTHN